MSTRLFTGRVNEAFAQWQERAQCGDSSSDSESSTTQDEEDVDNNESSADSTLPATPRSKKNAQKPPGAPKGLAMTLDDVDLSPPINYAKNVRKRPRSFPYSSDSPRSTTTDDDQSTSSERSLSLFGKTKTKRGKGKAKRRKTELAKKKSKPRRKAKSKVAVPQDKDEVSDDPDLMAGTFHCRICFHHIILHYYPHSSSSHSFRPER